MVYINNNGWTVGYADRRAAKEVRQFADDVRAHLERIMVMIEQYGLDQMREPYVKHVFGKIWEMRAKGRE